MRSGTEGRPPCKLLLCLLCLVVALRTDADDGTSVITSGDEFVEALTEFGRQGGAVTLQLDGSSRISLANVTWSEPQQDEFRSGSLTIEGHPPTNGGSKQAVLDAAMRSNLAPIGFKATTLLQDIVLINLCTRELPFNPIAQITFLSSDMMHLMPRSRIEQNYVRRNTTVYVPAREVLGLVYWLVLDSVPFPELRDGWVSVVLEYTPPTRGRVSYMDEYTLVLDFLKVPGGADENVTLRTTYNPNDPLGFKLPQRDLGENLMPHRFCASDGSDSGAPLTDKQVNEANFTAYPTYMVSNTAKLQRTLTEVSLRGLNPVIIRGEIPFPVIIVLQDVSVMDGSGVTSSALLQTATLLHGPLSENRPTFDMANTEGAIQLSSNAGLFIENLVVTGLKSAPISEDDAGLGSTTLSLVSVGRQPMQLVHFSEATLVVSKEDFLILLSAAHRGDRWKMGAVTTAPIIDGIDVFVPAEFDRSSLVLEEYRGWGVEGINLEFKPSTSLLESDVLLDPVLKKEDEGDRGGDTDAVAIGVGVGVGVGGGLILIAAVVAIVLARRRSARDAYQDSIKVGVNGEARMANGSGRGASHIGLPPLIFISPQGGFKEEEIGSKGISIDAEGQIVLDETSMNLKKIKEDQVVDSVNGKEEDPHVLVRREVEGLLKPTNDDVLKLECVLGKGGWGTVYKGTWKGLTVAVKTVLFTEHTGSEGKLPEKARAIMEAAVSTAISHPNLVSTYYYDIKPVYHDLDTGEGGLLVTRATQASEDWKLFLVLEYCHCTLGYAMRANLLHMGQMPIWDRVLQLLLDVAQGTLYLHNLQIIHGDLKPENVLLKADKEVSVGLVAKLTDFGLAISLGPTATHASNFRSGTPFYCAPEVSTSGRTTKASDVFSFGVVMCEVCSRSPPWMRNGSEWVVNPRFPSFAPGTPQVFEDLAMRCLDQDIHKRPKFNEIVAGLQEMLSDYEQSLE
uniref:Protein kinase domain-containing protein n=1 Tax=Dunaliella tertiolecta TaxID=3047 RepID=A0A7S3R7G0_DUNTE